MKGEIIFVLLGVLIVLIVVLVLVRMVRRAQPGQAEMWQPTQAGETLRTLSQVRGSRRQELRALERLYGKQQTKHK